MRKLNRLRRFDPRRSDIVDGSSRPAFRSSGWPTVLSLAPTSRCALSCPCCYLHPPFRPARAERDIGFFCGLLEQAASLGLEHVAVSINRFLKPSDPNGWYLRELSRVAVGLGLDFSTTTNYENIEQFGVAPYRNCRMVSLSYDEFKFADPSRLPSLLGAIDELKESGAAVNVNLMLSFRTIRELRDGLLGLTLQHADSAYLFMPKNYEADFTRAEFLEFLHWLLHVMQDYSVFRRVFLDNCVKPFFPPFSTLYPFCERGHHIVAVGPGGEVSYTVYDQPYAVIREARDFARVFREMFGDRRPDCGQASYNPLLCRKAGSCPFIRFREPR